MQNEGYWQEEEKEVTFLKINVRGRIIKETWVRGTEVTVDIAIS